MSTNLRSDVEAKGAFAQELKRRGFESVAITKGPADITARKNGEVFYYEVKYTSLKMRYFGAATLTEWEAALENESRFFFVVAMVRDGDWLFHEYTPEEFMKFSYVPPFKIFFNVAVDSAKDTALVGKSKKVMLSRERVCLLSELFRAFRPKKV